MVDHRTWVFLGDGCLMEGLSQEACSLAGTLKLGKLTALYDDNGISIDGPVSGWFADDTPARFEACGWHVIRDVNGNKAEEVDEALRRALAVTDKPTLICCKTVIGYGSPAKAGSAASHGAPLGPEEAAAAKAALGWSHPPFTVPDDIREAWDAKAKGRNAQAAWEDMFARYQAAYPESAAEFRRRMAGGLPASWPEIASALQADMTADQRKLATRYGARTRWTCWSRPCPNWWAARPTLPARWAPGPPHPGISRPAASAETTSIMGCASSAWARP